MWRSILRRLVPDMARYRRQKPLVRPHSVTPPMTSTKATVKTSDLNILPFVDINAISWWQPEQREGGETIRRAMWISFSCTAADWGVLECYWRCCDWQIVSEVAEERCTLIFRIKKFKFESEEATALRNVGKC